MDLYAKHGQDFSGPSTLDRRLSALWSCSSNVRVVFASADCTYFLSLSEHKSYFRMERHQCTSLLWSYACRKYRDSRRYCHATRFGWNWDHSVLRSYPSHHVPRPVGYVFLSFWCRFFLKLPPKAVNRFSEVCVLVLELRLFGSRSEGGSAVMTVSHSLIAISVSLIFMVCIY